MPPRPPGLPATTTIRSPASSRPSRTTRSSASAIIPRTWVPWGSGVAVSTPQNRAMRRLAASEVVRPMIGVRGRNRDT